MIDMVGLDPKKIKPIQQRFKLYAALKRANATHEQWVMARILYNIVGLGAALKFAKYAEKRNEQRGE